MNYCNELVNALFVTSAKTIFQTIRLAVIIGEFNEKLINRRNFIEAQLNVLSKLRSRCRHVLHVFNYAH